MSDNEAENSVSISLQVVVRGSATLKPVAVCLDSGVRPNDCGTNYSSGKPTETPAPESEESPPKYACQVCGSTRLRSDLNAFDVFVAQDDKLVHVRDEGTPVAFKGFTVMNAGRKLKLGGWEIYASNSKLRLSEVLHYGISLPHSRCCCAVSRG